MLVLKLSSKQYDLYTSSQSLFFLNEQSRYLMNTFLVFITEESEPFTLSGSVVTNQVYMHNLKSIIS